MRASLALSLPGVMLAVVLRVAACAPFAGTSTESDDGGGAGSEPEGGGADASAVVSADASRDSSADASGDAASAEAGPTVPIAFVQNLGVVHSASGTTMLRLTLTASTTAGDLIVARFGANAQSTADPSIVDTANDVWHLDANVSNGTIGNNQVWSTRASAGLVTGAVIVATFSGNAAPYTLVVDEFRGSELAQPAIAADNTGVMHVNLSQSDTTTDSLMFDAANRKQALAIGVVFLEDDSAYQEDTSDAGGATWHSLTSDFVTSPGVANLGNHGAYAVVGGGKGTVTYAPGLGVMQASVETMVVY
jgi:hypothetical protein